MFGLLKRGSDKKKPRRPQPTAYVISEGPRPEQAEADMRIDGGRRRAAEDGRKRIVVCGLLFAIAYGVVAVRLTAVSLSGAAPAAHAAAVEGDASQATGAPALRAEIVDRNGELLATNLPVETVEVDGRVVWDAAETAAALKTVLPDLDAEYLVKRLQAGRNVPIARAVEPKIRAEIFGLGLPGVNFIEETRRVYPRESLGAHVIGHVDMDGRGRMGLERLLDDIPAIDGGAALVSTVDIRAQRILEEELAYGFEKFSAKAAWGVVLDVHTGEVLALANVPDFDPNDAGAYPPAHRRNRATFDVYELGSAFKAFTVAAALETGAAKMDDVYDARKPLKIARHTIRDFHAQNRILTVPEVFMHSSNIGSAMMALDIGTAQHKDFLDKLNLFARIDMDFPERGRPLAPSPWRDINTATAAYGHGVAVTPLHLAAGMAAMVNGGAYVTPSFVKGAPRTARRVISEETSAKVRGLMRLVVIEGTGGAADVEGYRVGGKTATAEKAAAGGYDRKRLISSFVGVFPGDAPEYLILASLDEPKGISETHGYATAGWTAAPMVGRVIERLGPMFGVRTQHDVMTPFEFERRMGERAGAIETAYVDEGRLQ
ncbi:MAG: penicillin-binding protein 2 [Pseudomonadota bacterium]